MIAFVLHQISKISAIQGVNTAFMARLEIYFSNILDFTVYVRYMPFCRLWQLDKPLILLGSWYHQARLAFACGISCLLWLLQRSLSRLAAIYLFKPSTLFVRHDHSIYSLYSLGTSLASGKTWKDGILSSSITSASLCKGLLSFSICSSLHVLLRTHFLHTAMKRSITVLQSHLPIKW